MNATKSQKRRMSSSDEENGSKKSRNSQSEVNMSVEGDMYGVGRKKNESTKEILRAVLGGAVRAQETVRRD